MTTVETVWMSCKDAVQLAGIGGTITERHGEDREDRATYTVVRVTDSYVLLNHPNRRNSNAWTHEFADDTSEYDADRWSVASKGVEIETVRAFFEKQYSGVLVETMNNSRVRYLYCGFSRIPTTEDETSTDDDPKFRIRLISLRYGDVTYIHAYQLDEQNEWKVSENTNVDIGELQRIALRYNEYQVLYEDRNNDYRRVLREKNTLAMDFDTLNKKINEYADETGMCRDYERRIFGWNADLTTKLYGRQDVSWSIPVTCDLIDASQYGNSLTIIIEANSPDKAKQIAEQLTPGQLLGKLLDRGYVMKDMESPAKITGDAVMY